MLGDVFSLIRFKILPIIEECNVIPLHRTRRNHEGWDYELVLLKGDEMTVGTPLSISEKEELMQGLPESAKQELRDFVARRKSAGENMVGKQRRPNSDNGQTDIRDFLLPRVEKGAHAWILEDMFNDNSGD